VRYGGNYSAFEDLRAEQLAIQQASFSKQQEKIAHLQSFINLQGSRSQTGAEPGRHWNAWKKSHRFWPMPNLRLPLMNRAPYPTRCSPWKMPALLSTTGRCPGRHTAHHHRRAR
jgi:hypothetical protein